MGLDDLYKQAHSESHEAGLNAVYNQGFKDGVQGSAALVETLQNEVAALKQAPIMPAPVDPVIGPTAQGDGNAQAQT